MNPPPRSDPQAPNPQADTPMPPTMNPPMSKRQVRRLVLLAKNFDRAVESLPDNKGEEYKQEQQEVADARRKAQMSEGLLRMRVR